MRFRTRSHLEIGTYAHPSERRALARAHLLGERVWGGILAGIHLLPFRSRRFGVVFFGDSLRGLPLMPAADVLARDVLALKHHIARRALVIPFRRA